MLSKNTHAFISGITLMSFSIQILFWFVWSTYAVTTPSAIVTSATIAPPPTAKIFANATEEIGRFAISASGGAIRVQDIKIENSGSSMLSSIAISTWSIRLYDVDTWLQVSATGEILGNGLTFIGMNDIIGADMTRNYKVLMDISSLDSYYGQTIILYNSTTSAVNDSDGSPIVSTVTSLPMKTYTLGIIPPAILITAVSENLFKVKVTNPDSNTGITLTSAKFDFKTTLPVNTTYTASACLRDLGNTNTCDGSAGTSTATGTVPGLRQIFSMSGLTTSMFADKNNGAVEFEVYMPSIYLFPIGGQLQIALTQVDYNVGASADSETYVGALGTLATYTKGGVPTPDTTPPSVTINTKSGQLDPTSSSPVLYTAVFSEPINVSTFTKWTLSTSGSTATGIVINSITEVAPLDGTTFEISVSTSGTGKVVLSIPEGSTPKSYILGTTGLIPYGLVMDTSGNIYTANSDSDNVSKITPAWVSTIFGTTGHYPFGITIDNSGNIYTSNEVGNTVTKISSTGSSSTLGAAGNNPIGITIDNSGNIYTTGYNSGYIVSKITPTGSSSILGTTGDNPIGITIDNSGNIYTANWFNNNVSKITPTGSSSILGTTWNKPTNIVIDWSGNIYTANSDSNNVSKITPTGSSSILGTTWNYPYGIAIDWSGNIYTANLNSNNITKITPGGTSSIFGTTGDMPAGIIIDWSGNIYTSSTNSNTVSKITPHGIADLAGNYNTASTSTDNEVTIESVPVITTNPPIHETIQTYSAQTGYSFIMSGTTYLAIGNAPYRNVSEIVIPRSTGSSIPFQSLSGSIAAFEYFTLSGSSFLAVWGGMNWNNNQIYRFDGQSFTGFQTFPSNYRISGLSYFTISGTSYLAVASDETYGGHSYLYQWTGTGFSLKQTFNVDYGSAIKYFHLQDPDSQYFPYAEVLASNNIINTELTSTGYRLSENITRGELAVISAKIGAIAPTPTCKGDVFSDVNISLGDSCRYIEALANANAIPTASATFRPTDLATRAEIVTMILKALGETWSPIDAGYIDIGNIGEYTGYINRANEIGCIPNALNFYPNNPEKRGEVYKIVALASGMQVDINKISSIKSVVNWDYLALGGYNFSGIYKWNGTNFDLFQSGIGSNAWDISHFQQDGNEYLITSSDSSTIVYILLNGKFEVLQSFTHDGTGWSGTDGELFIYQGSYYLVVSSLINPISRIYKFIAWRFELTQTINTVWPDRHVDFEFFEINTQPYLFLVNGINTTNSIIYKWSPLPYVVIKSPISGTYWSNQNWNAQTTPISGLGSSWTTITISDGSGNTLWTGSVSGSGEFSILVSANSGTILPITATPYDGKFGEKKTLNYINITNSGTGITKDTTPPRVTLIGSSIVTVYSGSTYVDSGAIWSDNVDGSGTSLTGSYGNTGSFQSTGSVNTSLTGSYTIKYLKIDATGNSGSVSRTVNVVGSDDHNILQADISGTGTVGIPGDTWSGKVIVTNGYTINTTSTFGYLNIPGTVNFSLSGSAWNGLLYAPTASSGGTLDIGDAGVVSNLPQDNSTTDYSYTILPTLMAGGIGGTSVIATGWVFTLSMKVTSSSVHSGDTLPIFRSTDAVTWALNTPASSCIVDSNLMCTFTTDHLSYFGFVRVASTPIISASSTGPGGGGGGSSSSGIIPIGIQINSSTGSVSTGTMSTAIAWVEKKIVKKFLKLNMFADDTQNNTPENTTSENIDTTNNVDSTSAGVGTAYISVKHSLKVRATASLGSSVIAYLDRNQQVEILDNDTQYWSHIQFTTQNGQVLEGFVLSLYTRTPTKIDMIRDGIISFADAHMDGTPSGWYIDVDHSLNLRSGPSMDTRIKSILGPNTQVIILDTIGKWREILTETFHGFVLSKYIKQ